MLRRIAAIIFVIGIVGQAWASACVCGDATPVHSCCKRKIEKNAYFSTKGCCDGETCVNQRSTTPAAGLTQPATVVTDTVAVAVNATFFTTPELNSTEPVRDTVAAGSYRYRPRPPDLYVRHHAFRI